MTRVSKKKYESGSAYYPNSCMYACMYVCMYTCIYVFIVVDHWGLALKGLETLSSVFFNSDIAHNAAQIQTTTILRGSAILNNSK